MNWRTLEYFVEEPGEFISPSLPSTRTSGHINELEFPTEILHTVTWNVSSSNLVVCGSTDNSSPNMWYRKGKAKREAGLQLTRTFHRWLSTQRFRMYSFYCRSAHNTTADLLARASPEAIIEWAPNHQMAKLDPRGTRSTFCDTIRPPWKEWITPKLPSHLPVSPGFSAVEWQPIAFSACEASRSLGIT